jgi:hypothetical protein
MVRAQNSYLQSSAVTFNVSIRMPALPQLAVRVHIEGVRSISLSKPSVVYLRSQIYSNFACAFPSDLDTENFTAQYEFGNDCISLINMSMMAENSTLKADWSERRYAEVASTVWTDSVSRTFGDSIGLFLPATGSDPRKKRGR